MTLLYCRSRLQTIFLQVSSCLILLNKVTHSLNITYVIGDLHGDAHCAKHWVMRTNLISNILLHSETWQWIGDESDSLIFMGDYIDKGPRSRQTVEFVKSLTERFSDHVTAIMGNHELELLKDRREYRYWYYHQLPYATVHPEEYLNFINKPDDTDKLVIDALYNATLDVYGYNLYDSVQFAPLATGQGRLAIVDIIKPQSLRQLVSKRLNMYQKSYINAFRSGTELGKWVENRPIAHLGHDGTLYVHGGISDAVAKQLTRGRNDVDELNEKFHMNATEDRLIDFLDTVEGGIVEELIFYRGNHEPGACTALDKMIAMMDGVERIAVGHTPEDYVRMLCGGRFLALDSALGRWFRASGNMYCRGEKEEISSNGKFVCEKKNNNCEGQIVKLGDGEKVEILEALAVQDDVVTEL